jgi:hypothetical protein
VGGDAALDRRGEDGVKTWIMLVAAAILTVPLPGASQTSDEEAVLAVVRTLFDGMRQKDEALLRSVWHPDARLHSAGVDSLGKPRVTSTAVDSFVEGVLSAPVHLDEVTFDEEVRIDGNLAAAWTPYNLFIDDGFRHCGVDAFQLVRTSDGWKILQLTDTRTREGCDSARRGD